LEKKLQAKQGKGTGNVPHYKTTDPQTRILLNAEAGKPGQGQRDLPAKEVKGEPPKKGGLLKKKKNTEKSNREKWGLNYAYWFGLH